MIENLPKNATEIVGFLKYVRSLVAFLEKQLGFSDEKHDFFEMGIGSNVLYNSYRKNF